MKVFYFTATGNSLYVAKRIGGELYSIPKVLKEGTTEFTDEVIGIVFPTYSFTAPKIVMEFMKNVKLNSQYLFAVMTYGNAIADGPKWLSRFAGKCGIELNYSNSLLMIDDFLPLFDIDQQKTMDKKIEENLARILRDIEERKQYIQPGGIGGRIVRNITQAATHVFSGLESPKMFEVNEACVGCKTCQNVCPRSNISVSDKKVEFKNVCEYCLACVNNCPKKAIAIKREKNPNSRFRNDNVILHEIIESNNQNNEWYN